VADSPKSGVDDFFADDFDADLEATADAFADFEDAALDLLTGMPVRGAGFESSYLDEEDDEQQPMIRALNRCHWIGCGQKDDRRVQQIYSKPTERCMLKSSVAKKGLELFYCNRTVESTHSFVFKSYFFTSVDKKYGSRGICNLNMPNLLSGHVGKYN
jgi:hypothetical protein